MIDDLLQAVSPELVAGYEAKNLDGKTLRGVHEEYKVVSTKRGKMIMAKPFFGILLPFILVISLLVFGQIMVTKGASPFFAFASPVIAFVAWMYFDYRALNTAWGYNKTIARSEEVFDAFWRAVKALDPKWHVGDVLTEENARKTLIGYALRLLDAEVRTKETRMKERVSTWELRDSANWEDKSRDEFEKMLSTAEKFGLVYAKKDKDELFAEAQKRLNKYK